MKFSCFGFAAVVAMACMSTARAGIIYTDAVSTFGGTNNVEWLNGGTWTNSGGWTANKNGASSAGDGLWDRRTSGPATNAYNTTSFQAAHAENAPALRMIVNGLDATKSYDFYVYGVKAGGSDIIQAAVSSDIGSNAALPALTTYVKGVDVLSDNSEGTSGSGDQRRRHFIGSISGATSYAVYVDDFNGGSPGGDRVNFDGIGYEVSAVPEPSSVLLLGMASLLGLVRRRR